MRPFRLMYERTDDLRHKGEAYRHFNWATYSTHPNGLVSVGPRWTGTWWSDGYGDYIRHFMEGLAAVPEWAPSNENHLLRSSSVVQQIRYDAHTVSFGTFDDAGAEVLRLTLRPTQVKVGDRILAEQPHVKENSWSWTALSVGGVLRIQRDGGREVIVTLR